VFLLVFLSLFPVVVLFIFISNARLALRIFECGCSRAAVSSRVFIRALHL